MRKDGRLFKESQTRSLLVDGYEESVNYFYLKKKEFNQIMPLVELEKTIESPLDCKEIKPVCPKGNQS